VLSGLRRVMAHGITHLGGNDLPYNPPAAAPWGARETVFAIRSGQPSAGRRGLPPAGALPGVEVGDDGERLAFGRLTVSVGARVAAIYTEAWASLIRFR
jgi:hypothetical protein